MRNEDPYQVIGLIVLLLALLGGAAYVIQPRVLLPGFTGLEREAARTDMERVVLTVAGERDMTGGMIAFGIVGIFIKPFVLAVAYGLLDNRVFESPALPDAAPTAHVPADD